MIRILQQNNRFTKVLFAVIIGIAVISMVAYLIPGFMDSGSATDPNVYATVHEPGFLGRFGSGVTVKTAEVNQVAQRQLQQQRLPDFLLPYMVQRAGQLLVQRAMLKNEAGRMDLEASADDVRQEIRTQYGQVFFPNGQFIGDTAYINLLSSQGVSVKDFEESVKSSIELNRLQAMITGGVTVSDNAVRDAYKVQGTKVKFDYAVVSGDELRKTINPSDAELESFFKTSAARYATAVPETRKIQYVAFDASNLPGGRPQIGDAEYQTYYNAHKDQYEVKEQVRVRHILIAAAAGDAKAEAAAKAKAEAILKQIKAGGDFADLAAKNSDDPGSKVQGGELGWLDRGKTVPEFDKAAFTLAPGQTSELVKTQFGYHILQTEEKKTAHLRPLAEVKPEIIPILEQQKSGVAMQNFATQLAAEAKNGGQSGGLAKVAAAHTLKLVTTDYLPKEGAIAGLADGSGLMTQAFTAAKDAAPATASTGDGVALFQVTDIKAAHAPAFADYKSHVLDDYREQQLPQLLNAQLNKLDDRAKVLNDLKKAAAEMKIPIKTSDLVGKDGQVPDLGAMSGPGAVAFTLPVNSISAPINAGRVGIVLSVVEKQEPSTEDVAKNFEATREQLLNTQHEEIFRIYMGGLTDKYNKGNAIRYSQKQPPAGASPFGN